MDVKQLRNEVQLLRDELAIMKRKYEDIIYNLDTDNFSSRFVKEQGDMRTAIEQTEEKISLQAEEIGENSKNIASLEITAESIESEVFEENEDGTKTSRIKQNANNITSEVEARQSADSTLSSRITQTSNKISAVISGDYTEDMLNNYLTGIEITPHKIKMIDDDVYSVYNNSGLRFYDSADQIEGWAIEPSNIGGVLTYYVNGGICYKFGAGESGDGYTSTDISLKAINSYRSGFVVDVTECGWPYVKFVGLDDYSDSENEPQILANGMKLATQRWVLENAGGSGGTVVAVFG